MASTGTERVEHTQCCSVPVSKTTRVPSKLKKLEQTTMWQNPWRCALFYQKLWWGKEENTQIISLLWCSKLFFANSNAFQFIRKNNFKQSTHAKQDTICYCHSKRKFLDFKLFYFIFCKNKNQKVTYIGTWSNTYVCSYSNTHT